MSGSVGDYYVCVVGVEGVNIMKIEFFFFFNCEFSLGCVGVGCVENGICCIGCLGGLVVDYVYVM